MASRMKAGGMHTAGIFSDMTVDGPEIGTLVVIVDRAKNLPNRKTIGKQDPYCAARLGKEAKKTETDRRGGQTPRWDQELRFTVHDSPDYYQLKVSVFNDDKKTDLIGETWVSLQDIIVPGGGQNDIWHNLNCKGKYAGEIRIEITYYDTRPKEEKPLKTKQSMTNAVEEGGRDSLKGPRQPKAAVKRRPLPSDPVTGAPPPSAIPEHVQAPPRGYQSPTATPEHTQTPPRGHSHPNNQEYAQIPPRAYQQPSAIPDHVQTPPRGPPASIPDHVQTPSRGYPSPGYGPDQSPLQRMEYNTPPSHFSPGGYDKSPNSNVYVATTPSSRQHHHEKHESYDQPSRNDYMPSYTNNKGLYEDEEIVSRDTYNHHAPYELPQPEDFGTPPSPGGPPPPPPAHGSRHGNSHTSPAPPMRSNGSYGFSQDSASPLPYSAPTNSLHRNSTSNYSHPKSYMAYSLLKKEEPFQKSEDNYQESSPRNHSYDSRYNTDYASMQPTVEDELPSPSNGQYSRSHRGSVSRSPGYDDPRYDEVPSPAPLNLSGRGSSTSNGNISSAPSHQYSNSMGYTSTNSQISLRELSQTGTSYNTMSQQQHQIPRKPSASPILEAEMDYGLPLVPATLVAGMDPIIAQEISDRIYDEKRASQGVGQSSHGRYQEQPQYQHDRFQQQESYESGVMVPYVPASAPSINSYDERQSRYSSVPAQRPRGLSPDPRVPARKSVSPSPVPSQERRLSGIPFGPDSYNALNPTIAGSKSNPSLSARYDPKDADVDEKIITHDGREIDPSDHIPESNYAPLLESKGPKYASQQPDRNYRPPPSSAQTSSGRRPLKVAARPQSMAVSHSSQAYMNTGPADLFAPQTGRNRLQKKANRISAMPAPHSSPLAPITPYQNNSHTPRSFPRPSTGSYDSNENYSPSYGAGYRGGAGPPPPIPAKVPIMNSAPPQDSGDAWALLEEMKTIDLGSGRARRRGY